MIEVGVLGGYGAVGEVAARCLASDGFAVRIGGRQATSAVGLARDLATPGQGMRVDAADPDSVAAFADGCRVVLNCAGPGYLLSEPIRRAVLAAGVDYVDVMDDGLDTTAVARTVVLGAGLVPGLSRLLPKLLGDGVAVYERFTGAYAGLGTLTPAAAADYLLSGRRGYGTPFAAWRGRVTHSALRIDEDFRLPGVARALTGYPFLTEELRAQAAALGIGDASWHNAFDGPYLLAALSRLQGHAELNLTEAAAEIVQASALDAAGRVPYHLLHATMAGWDRDGHPIVRTALIRGADGSAITDAITAAGSPPGRTGWPTCSVHRRRSSGFAATCRTSPSVLLGADTPAEVDAGVL